MTDIYQRLADLLEYPDVRWTATVSSAYGSVADSESFAKFIAGTDDISLSELQELYTRTFDLSPVCALDIGYHLFGENYKRGVFLANLRETESPFDLGQEHQLPDYLPVLLRLLTKLDDDELRGALIKECMIPALGKMLKAFGEGDNPYRHLIAGVTEVLKSEAGVDEAMVQRAHLPVLSAAAFSETNTDLF
jgi:nitrate reductase molybdenum cofactor assembly chaperone NarJ/NarW